MEGVAKKEHSRLGIASFIIIIFVIISIFVQYMGKGILQQLEIFHSWTLTLGLPLAALVLGILSLVLEKNRKKIFAILGISLSILVEIPLVGFYSFAYIFLHSVMNH